MGKWMGIQGWRDYHLSANVSGTVIHAAGSTDGLYTIDLQIEQLHVGVQAVSLPKYPTFIRIEVFPSKRNGAPLPVHAGEVMCISGMLMWDADGFLEIHPKSATDIMEVVNPASVSIKQGQTASTTITIAPSGGYSQPASLSCSGFPSNATCSFSPTTLTPTTSITSQMTLTTTAATVSFGRPPASAVTWGDRAVMALMVCTLFGYRRRLVRSLFLILISVVGSALVVGCGTPKPVTGSPGTPVGNYTITVTASGGAVTHTIPITLAVN
jgi:hypothetical protein